MIRVLAVAIALALAGQAWATQYPGTPPNAVPLAKTTGLQNLDVPLAVEFPPVAGWTNFVTQIICTGEVDTSPAVGATATVGLLGKTVTGDPPVQLDLLFAIVVSADLRIAFNITLSPPLPGVANEGVLFLVPVIAGAQVSCNMLGYRLPNSQLE